MAVPRMKLTLEAYSCALAFASSSAFFLAWATALLESFRAYFATIPTPITRSELSYAETAAIHKAKAISPIKQLSLELILSSPMVVFRIHLAFDLLDSQRGQNPVALLSHLH